MASLPSAMNTLAAPCRHFPEFNFMEKHPPSILLYICFIFQHQGHLFR